MEYFNEYEQLTEEELEEVKSGLRQQMKLFVLGLEVLWEELQKSNLPENIKISLMSNYKSKGE